MLSHRIPKVTEPLEFQDGLAYLAKTDILQEIMYFTYEKGSLSNLYPVAASEVAQIIMMNRNGQKPESLKSEPEPVGPQFVSAVGDDSITRFDKPKKNKNKNRNKNKVKPVADQAARTAAPADNAEAPSKPRSEGGNFRGRNNGPRRNGGSGRPQQQRPRGDRKPEQKPVKTDE